VTCASARAATLPVFPQPAGGLAADAEDEAADAPLFDGLALRLSLEPVEIRALMSRSGREFWQRRRSCETGASRAQKP
jgi:hypothetical protein